MQNQLENTELSLNSPRRAPWRDDEGRLDSDWIERVRDLIAHDGGVELRQMMAPLQEADAGDVLEALNGANRLALIRMLGDEFDYSSLTEVDEVVRVELIDQLPNSEVARGVSSIENDDAVFILEDIEETDRDAILALVPEFDRLSLRRSLEFPEDSAGRRMQCEFIAVPPYWTVGQTIDYMRKGEGLPEEFYQLYVIDPNYSLQGTISLDKILRATRPTVISEIMDDQVIDVAATEDQEDAARIFERFDLVELGVVDESNRLVGVLTIDDMVDVIHEEAEEDIRLLAGVGNEEVSDGVWEAVRSRTPWLVVNLATAVLASMVIARFDVSLQKMVALAVLMPIVASMGGNAGTQAMTVTVRAISTQDLDQFNIRRLIMRETLVGLANGVIFAVITGLLTAIWFTSVLLGAVIGVAMVVNMLAAGIAGILIPLGLNRFGADPAVASSAFVTTITDVVGFFVFLGLAVRWFGLG